MSRQKPSKWKFLKDVLLGKQLDDDNTDKDASKSTNIKKMKSFERSNSLRSSPKFSRLESDDVILFYNFFDDIISMMTLESAPNHW